MPLRETSRRPSIRLESTPTHRVCVAIILLTLPLVASAQDPTADSAGSIVTATSKIEFEMKPRPTDEKDFPAYIRYLVDVAEPRTPEERAADEKIKKRYRDALVVDSLFVGAPGFPAGFTPEMYEEAIQHSDYVFNYADTLLWILKNPANFPIEMGYATPSHMGKPGEVWGVVRELEETFGWTEQEIRGFLGGNLMRVYEANWQ
jgi:membrane dipeptidase